jgi:predicted RNA-binding Zn ribbon-like protein
MRADDSRTSEETRPGPIPHTLSPYLCIDFVNSRFTNHTGTGEVYDRLAMRGWQRWFAERAGVGIQTAPPPKVYRDLLKMRAVLRELLLSRERPDAATVRLINRHLARAPTTWQVADTGGDLRLEVVQPRAWEAVLAAVLLSYAELLTNGQPQRVRCCANPHCTFVFYDTSHNASRRWCDPAACGNLHAVRQHRQRAQHGSQTSRP